jgi:aminoglycoside phosphotransferase family enzyme/predicted kinase
MVIMIGERAYKTKKPIDLGFLDYRSEASRRQACEREVELNRRLAPDVYLDVLTICGSDGQVLDHAVAMRRMPDELRLADMIRRGAPVASHLQTLAVQLAKFHAHAPRSPEIAREAGPVGLRRRWTDNLHETQRFRDQILSRDLHQKITDYALAYIDGRADFLTERADAGFAVDGHGDLLTEDIFCLPDYPRVLDCLEFDDRLRWVDVIDDVAFLAMDLEHLGRLDLGQDLFRWYVEASGDLAPLSLRNHYLAYRAFVRAKVACIRATQGDAHSADEARAFADICRSHLVDGEVRLVLVGGAPGTGKSTLATALAAETGAVHLSTDGLRADRLGPGPPRYTEAAKRATYRTLLEQAELALTHGRSVIADATWARRFDREAARDVAAKSLSRFIELECQAPIELAASRAQKRYDTGSDVSDADARIARRLARERDPWPQAFAIDTTGPVSRTVQEAIKGM